tara:strand:- start:2336 stop:2929 length:594 start_codon:yes stop_codon:yes gene_type:complete
MSVPSDNRAILTTGLPNLYCTGPADALLPHKGIMFPNLPDISYSQSVQYTPYDLVHTNYSFSSYRNTPSPDIILTGMFAQTTDEEHRYLQGVIHFLRCVTKMFYGINERDPAPGTPPPVLRFSAFGTNVFKNIPVLVQNFSVNIDSNTDLKTVDGQSLSTIQTVTMNLIVQQSPARQKTRFSMAEFSSGNLYQEGFI